jgi:hypothetical protein
MAMYIHEMVLIEALPQGAEQTAPSLNRGAVAGQEGHELFGHADRADARAAAAVRDAEGLVQVEVADVRADEAGLVRPTCAFMFAPSM